MTDNTPQSPCSMCFSCQLSMLAEEARKLGNTEKADWCDAEAKRQNELEYELIPPGLIDCNTRRPVQMLRRDAPAISISAIQRAMGSLASHTETAVGAFNAFGRLVAPALEEEPQYDIPDNAFSDMAALIRLNMARTYGIPPSFYQMSPTRSLYDHSVDALRHTSANCAPTDSPIPSHAPRTS